MKTAITVNSLGVPNGFHINPDWAKLPLFDRKGWKRVRFGDVVENLKPRGTIHGCFIPWIAAQSGARHR